MQGCEVSKWSKSILTWTKHVVFLQTPRSHIHLTVNGWGMKNYNKIAKMTDPILLAHQLQKRLDIFPSFPYLNLMKCAAFKY
jgi:hypothetical protein